MDSAPARNRDIASAEGFLRDELFELAIESSPSGVIIVGPAGTIVKANARLEWEFGYEHDELVGRHVEALVPEWLRSVHAPSRSDHFTQAETQPMNGSELVGCRKDGSQIPVEIGLSPIDTASGVYVLASVVNINDRVRVDREHREAVARLIEFEQLVGELSTSFVNLPPERVDDAIRDALQRLTLALDLDRGTLFQAAEGLDDFVLTHYWQREDQPPPDSLVSATREFPWSLARIRNGELACFALIDDVPDAVEREALRRYGTKSRVALPLSIGGRIAGVVAFASVREGREWPRHTIDRLQLVAQVFSNALARKASELALRASEERFRSLADDAPVMIWVSGTDTTCSWLNRRWLDFVGRTMEQELGDGWAHNVHPEDLSACLQVYRSAFESRRSFSTEFRLRRHDGEWRWMLGKGMPTFGADGVFKGYLGSCLDVTEQKQAKLELESALAEVRRLRDQLQLENVYLRQEVQERLGQGTVVGQSAAVRRVLEQVEQVAATDSTVLLLGETGTGKELFASLIHERSARHTRAMVRVNCAAIPSTLIESELFGREKGAFTGALARQIGRFEMADRSTIFLDEVGDLPGEVQVKLLRVLEERQIERLGSPRGIAVDVRIIAATHRDLEQLMAAGTFRDDLYYRLNVFPIRVPPLREREEDIPLLVWRFVEEFAKAFGKRIESIGRDNMAALQAYAWPGNIRELRNVVERAMITATGTRLTIPVPASTTASAKRSTKLVDVEKSHIRSVLESTNWRIRGAGGAADRLGLKPTTLETRLAKLGVRRPSQH